MKIRYLTVQDKETAESLVSMAKDFGLTAVSRYSGCDNYFNLVVAEKPLPLDLLEELFESPPNGHDWSDCEHDVASV